MYPQRSQKGLDENTGTNETKCSTHYFRVSIDGRCVHDSFLITRIGPTTKVGVNVGGHRQAKAATKRYLMVIV